MWIFLIISTLAWGIAEIFYKKGSFPHEKYAHIKTSIFVGIFFGIYATIILFTQGIDLASFPINFLIYLPVALCYIVSMICSYFGVRFIEESICDPIENTSGALVPILCAIFLHESFEIGAIISIVIITIGLILVSVFDKKSKEERKKKYGKKLAIWAFLMPFCYLILDAVGTFLDIFYTDDITTTVLINVTENNLEHTANCCYEFTFFLVAIIGIIYLKVKGQKIFSIGSDLEKENSLKWYQKIWLQKDKILASIFEMIGQATYLFALSSGQGIAAIILCSGTVIVSLILSRIILKEKLTIPQYCSIILMVGGIIMLSLLGV